MGNDWQLAVDNETAMIISASRRTDIPAFYSQWFFNRLTEGEVMVRNPMNPKQVSRICLDPGRIDAIVFWTRNPRPMLDRLDRLDRCPFYFLFTVTPYGKNLEPGLPPREQIIATFKQLSRRIGRERVVWRYDPILLTGRIDENVHLKQFTEIAQKLAPYTERCIISFLDMYNKCKRNLKGFNIIDLEHDPDRQRRIGEMLGAVAKENGIELNTCAQEIDLKDIGIGQGKCIDDQLLERISGCPMVTRKDRNQRKNCRCIESIDIGAYDSCSHLCLYCYANTAPGAVRLNINRHDPESPLLIGTLSGDEKITQRVAKSFKTIS